MRPSIWLHIRAAIVHHCAVLAILIINDKWCPLGIIYIIYYGKCSNILGDEMVLWIINSAFSYQPCHIPHFQYWKNRMMNWMRSETLIHQITCIMADTFIIIIDWRNKNVYYLLRVRWGLEYYLANINIINKHSSQAAWRIIQQFRWPLMIAIL